MDRKHKTQRERNRYCNTCENDRGNTTMTLEWSSREFRFSLTHALRSCEPGGVWRSLRPPVITVSAVSRRGLLSNSAVLG